MDWDKLKIFHTVAEAGSFTNASTILNLSQSAISRQIQALENDLKVQLFERHARGLVLTENGEYLFKSAHEVISRLKDVESNLSGEKDKLHGKLAVTTVVSFGTTWLTPRIKEFMDLHPGIRVELIFDDKELDLSTREADVAIRMGAPTQPDLIQRHLMTVHSHIYAAPSYIDEFGPIEDADDLMGQSIIVYGEGPLITIANPNWMLSRVSLSEGRHRVVLETNNVYCILQAVESGLGISTLPDYVARDRPKLRQILPRLQGPSFDAYLVYAEELRHTKRIAVFRDFLLGQVAAWNY